MNPSLQTLLTSISSGAIVIATITGAAWFLAAAAESTRSCRRKSRLMKTQAEMEARLERDAASIPAFSEFAVVTQVNADTVEEATTDAATPEPPTPAAAKDNDLHAEIAALRERCDRLERRFFEDLKRLEGKAAYRITLTRTVVATVAALALLIAVICWLGAKLL